MSTKEIPVLDLYSQALLDGMNEVYRRQVLHYLTLLDIKQLKDRFFDPETPPVVRVGERRWTLGA